MSSNMLVPVFYLRVSYMKIVFRKLLFENNT